MSSKTKIEWADAVINPMRGCRKISPGCKHCYAATFAGRFRGVKGHPYERGFDPRVVPEALDKIPKKPRVYFVNSMSDLFLEDFSPRQIADVFAAFTWHPKRTFLILTKRAERMRELMDDDGPIRRYLASTWPPPNVWLGVSAEDQQRADERIPLLLQTPAAHRFVSLEPLLGPIDIGMSSATCDCCPRWSSRWVRLHGAVRADFPFTGVAPAGIYRAESNPHGALSVITPKGTRLGIKPNEFEDLPRIDQVIAGGESGAGARECRVEWLRSLRDQCAAAGVPFFLKQLGSRPTIHDPEHQWWDGRNFYTGGQRRIRLKDRKGGDPSEWPEDLRRCRELAWRQS